jgi:hypothetical protein
MSLILFAILSAASPTPASDTCGPTKFTLNKPVQTQAVAKKPDAKAAPKPKPKTEIAKAKTKPLADCDKPKKG